MWRDKFDPKIFSRGKLLKTMVIIEEKLNTKNDVACEVSFFFGGGGGGGGAN